MRTQTTAKKEQYDNAVNSVNNLDESGRNTTQQQEKKEIESIKNTKEYQRQYGGL